ncbi:MAG TPA: hypothetical protein VFG68_20395, partial [Fimbriiglobus sp.]|nr:hypothetical protein [Fimbriiglobus sp.]
EEALEGVATGSGSPVAEACGMLIEDGPEKRTFLSGPNCGHIYWGLTFGCQIVESPVRPG